MYERMPVRGGFVTFEGVEGAGKSTQLCLLAAWLREQGFRVRETREAGGTPVGEAIRAILHSSRYAGMDSLTELFLFEAGRRQHVVEVIEPALAAGEIVLSDRFADASVAYQGHGRGVDLQLVERLNALVVGDARPDLTIVLDLDVGEGLRRSAARRGEEDEDRFELAGASFHEVVRKGYWEMAEREPDRIVLIKADGPVETIQGQIRGHVQMLLARRGIRP